MAAVDHRHRGLARFVLGHGATRNFRPRSTQSSRSKRPEDIGLLPDGATEITSGAKQRASNVVDPAWAAQEWTLARAVRTSRFWWIVVGYFCALVAWYAVQVHQTKYLIETGFTPLVAAWSLGLVSIVGIPGQISLGALSDRVGREWYGQPDVLDLRFVMPRLSRWSTRRPPRCSI